MRSRTWALLCLLLVLVVATACSGSPFGQTATATPRPVRTLRPTFTPASAAQGVTIPPTSTRRPTMTPTATVPVTPTTPPTAEPPTPTPEPTASQVAMLTVVNATLNVRGGPGTSYPVIGQVRQGDQYDITGKNPAGDWWQINYEGQAGWVLGTMVSVNEAAASVQVAANIPTAPTARPQPTAGPRPPTQPPAPPPATTKFAQAGAEFRSADNSNFDKVTFWGRLGPTGLPPVAGDYKLRITCPTGTGEQSFSNVWQTAYGGFDSEFRYGAKVELPKGAGSYRAVVIDGGGQEVSDAISGNLADVTHDVILSWVPR